jgi:site-specific recombinase XerD
MGTSEIEAFLTHLAIKENVAASTQSQALSALLFLYREVLTQELALITNSVRVQKPRRLPTVLTREEVQKVIGLMKGTHQLIAKLLYAGGLRLMECVQLHE